MLKIFRNLSLISKDEFDYSLYQCTSSENGDVPTSKYMKPIIECLKGQDQKILPLDAFNKFYDILCQIQYNKWISALKIGYVLHYCLEKQCNIFVDAVCNNHLYDKIKNKQQRKPEDPIAQLHINIVQNLFSYLQIRYENYLFFLNALSDFEEKEQYQKTFIIHKIVSTIQVLVKIHKDLDISLTKFNNIEVTKHICVQLLNDLYFFYPKVQIYLQSHINQMLQMESEQSLKLYQVYTETLRLGRSVTQMLKLCNEVVSIQSFPQLILFTVEQNINRQIELHFKEQKRQPSPIKFDIIRFDDENLFEQYKDEQINTPKVLQQFQKMVTQLNENQYEPQPDQIEFQISHKPKTERQLQQFKVRKSESNEQSMIQSIISTSDNCSSVRNIQFSHQNSFKNEFFNHSESPLNFIDFSHQQYHQSKKKQ
ncbi:unnamed protein product [Paramecium primaurelia]|uniref:Uncharacterized protein n=1 Tax=Paramecium primaurelia TaxID=5886 RepID=A0A8S1MYU3_PARPR|nr:unnamed protein product [Paramecium primaurelia]